MYSLHYCGLFHLQVPVLAQLENWRSNRCLTSPLIKSVGFNGVSQASVFKRQVSLRLRLSQPLNVLAKPVNTCFYWYLNTILWLVCLLVFKGSSHALFLPSSSLKHRPVHFWHISQHWLWLLDKGLVVGIRTHHSVNHLRRISLLQFAILCWCRLIPLFFLRNLWYIYIQEIPTSDINIVSRVYPHFWLCHVLQTPLGLMIIAMGLGD